MKFSAQEEYGLRCLLSIARADERGCLTIPEIAEREGITQPHAAKLLSILRQKGFIRSTRGQTGGYALALPPEKLLIGNVLEALGGRLYESQFCEKHTGVLDACAHAVDCDIRGVWARVQSAVDQVVMNLTLRDVMEGRVGPAPVTVRRTKPAARAQAAR